MATRMSSLSIGYFPLITIFICLNGINCFQRFSEQPKYTEVNPGQDALLTCKVIDKRGTCSWQKDNKPVGIYAKKYEWAAQSSLSSSSNGVLHLDLHPPPLHIGGDCSLWIRSATLDFDDGLWECQVTASDFTTQDALTSQPVRLVVRVAPQRPRLEHEGAHVPPGHNITVDSGAIATVKCVSHYGNPPATLKWFLGDQEISPLHPQVNSTEPDNSRTWSASSVVQVPAMRERHGDMLRCLAFHESYSAKSAPVEGRLDIRYAPSIRLIGSPEIDLEEDKDVLILRCVADANPPAKIVWRRAGRSELSSSQETLQLRPVGRRDAGLYTCQAQNSVGISEQLSVQLDVKYPPRILSAGPDRLTTAPLFSPAAFECVAEGNPLPLYKWVQRISHGTKYVERGNEARLVIDNVTYDYQGEYECRATSYINGQERVAISEPISLQVVGAPQVLRLNPSMHSVSVKRGEPASLSLVVCADPRPHRVAWEWGSLRLQAGSAAADRFRADEVIQDSREDCYLATLHIQQTDEHDSRPYYLVVENERGTDRHAIHLNVEEPLEMSYLMGIAGGSMAAIFILTCLCIYAIRGRKCCFKGNSGYKSSDKDSEKADLKSRSDSTSGPQGDSIYTTPAGFHNHHQHHPGHGSPEAMKSTTTTTTTLADEQGRLIWQEEEIIHQQQHHPKVEMLLRHNGASGGGAILSKNNSKTSGPPSMIHRQRSGISGSELLTTHQRHQRDLFSGDLGIPEINTHVGSVIHTFETMAMLRRQQQARREEQLAADNSNCKYSTKNRNPQTKMQQSSASLPQPQSSRSIYGTSNSKYNQLKRKSHECRQKFIEPTIYNLASSFPKITSNKFNRQKSSDDYYNSLNFHMTTPGNRSGFSFHNFNHLSPIYAKSSVCCEEKFKNDDDHFDGMFDDFDEDYRKNLFGTLPQRKYIKHGGNSKAWVTPTVVVAPSHLQKQQTSSTQTNPDEIAVNEAFDGIFSGYSCAEDDDDDIDDVDDDGGAGGGELNFDSIKNFPNQLSEKQKFSHLFETHSKPRRPSHKKGPPPPPPPSSSTVQTSSALTAAPQPQSETVKKSKSLIAPLSQQKPYSAILANFLDRIKSTKAKCQSSKTPADRLLQNDHYALEQELQSNRCAPHKSALHLTSPPASPALQRQQYYSIESHPSNEFDEDENFLRGTTLSQSFVKNLKASYPPPPTPPATSFETRINNDFIKSPAPPQPPQKPHRLTALTTAAQQHNFANPFSQQSSKSFNQLISTDLEGHSPGNYYQSIGPGDDGDDDDHHRRRQHHKSAASDTDHNNRAKKNENTFSKFKRNKNNLMSTTMTTATQPPPFACPRTFPRAEI